MKSIKIFKAFQNNLKGFDLEIPFYKFIVVTGVSGAGKSSLVFDTLYAEGQRRYIETFSTYIRQFFEKIPSPRVERIENIPPAISFPQGNYIKTSRSTVATLTEINHFVKMLYFYYALPYCPICGKEITSGDPLSIAKKILETFHEKPIYITVKKKVEKSFEYLKKGLLFSGFSRIVLKDRVCDLEEIEEIPENEVEILLLRTRPSEKEFSAILKAVEEGFKIGPQIKVRTLYGEEVVFNKEERCACGFVPPRKVPEMFSFNSGLGACPECNGFGNLLLIDLEALVEHPEESLVNGAIPLLEFSFLSYYKKELISYLKKNYKVNPRTPFFKLPEEVKKKIWEGDFEWIGIKRIVEALEEKKYKPHVRILLSRLRKERTCPACGGKRFNKNALVFKYHGLDIGDFYSLEVKNALEFVSEILKSAKRKGEAKLLEEVQKRLSYLKEVGLDYLTLNRPARTLSGGEVSRCFLIKALSSSLSETLFLIDEPTTGLHPLDNQKIVKILERIVKNRNTVVVVEHDTDVILSADELIELGPEGGEKGGYLLFQGEPEKILEKDTPTSQELKRIFQKRIFKKEKKSAFSSWVKFKNLKRHNLKGINVKIPLNRITVISGPSGSGKTSLLEEINEILSKKEERVLFLSREPVSLSHRICVASYVGIYEFIKKLFASTKEAKKRGYTPNYFSFYSSLGACPECNGAGYEVVEMQFLSDLYFPCEVCKGRRFRSEILEVEWRGKNIAQVLELTVKEGREFFGKHPLIQKGLEILEILGLDYLKLGQPLHTLSYGEAERIKIARVLLEEKNGGKKTFILFDEPTVGLHLKDIGRFLNLLEVLLKGGATCVIVEHHPEIILSADWVIELGPEGGEKGGHLLFQGNLKNFLKKSTKTSQYLKNYLKGQTFKKREKKGYKYEKKVISLQGVSHHNLSGVSLEIPREKFVVITGVSGSGKSTLAFDVIYKEGQRRFFETLPAYLKQFFNVFEEISYEKISGISPTIALEQKSGELSPKGTVGTITDILSYLRLLYAKVSDGICPSCGRTLRKLNILELPSFVKEFLKEKGLERVKIFVPLVKNRKGEHRNVISQMLKQGYHYFRIDGILHKVPPIPRLYPYQYHNIEIYLGEKPVKSEGFEDLIKKGAELGRGEIILSWDRDYLISVHRVCPECFVSLPEPDPLLFAFNSKVGACPECNGLGCEACEYTRYNEKVKYYKVFGYSLPELLNFSISQLKEILRRAFKFKGKKQEIAEPLIKETLKRLECLEELGVGYLSLSRGADTLSSGELKRVLIAQAVGTNLTGVIYILDEPTIGLHPRDTKKLIKVLKSLKNKGNTVITIEHDEEVILSADYVVELGPGGGKKGGKILFAGSLKEFKKREDLPTGQALRDETRRRLPEENKNFKDFIELKKVKYRNLKGINVKIPLGSLTVVVGVSGSGKSSLICDYLPSLKDFLKKSGYGTVSVVDHSPIGRTPRSVPATYIGVFNEIRDLFASLPEAQIKGLTPSHFSFNLEAGFCENCKGQGVIKRELKFLPVVYETCEVCQGKRYKEHILEVSLNGKNICDILEMTFEEAAKFFEDYPGIYRKLKVVCDIGLDYLTLGQPSYTLSGGESQRIKLAREFVKSTRAKKIYILDEPSTGLHIKDVGKLIKVLKALVEKGHTVIVIEHNVEVIKWADWVIELGPEGGEKGGHLLFQGYLKEFLKKDTPTSTVLKNYFQRF